MENEIKLLSINEIIKEKFLIPSYQRGYRWEKRQVTELLDDIWEFSQQERKKDEFYCLQPIVVKKNGDKWEVIDGQQRLTTIYIILYFLGRKRYDIEFETREKSKEFLQNIDVSNTSNIDYFFIGQAYKTIKEWFEYKENVESEYTVRDEFSIALGKLTKIIWYEVNDGSNPINIFTRLNIGKIPLTNAELIKALFLQKSNKNNNDNDTFRLKQLEIASEWDRIEYTLQNDEFWSFINKEFNDMPTRIEYIFNAMAKKSSRGDDFYTFRYFNERLRQRSVQEIWDEVKAYFLTFEDWFNDRELFHLIGYLVTCGERIEQLKDAAEGKSKTEFRKYIDNKIRQHVNYKISELDYEKNSNEIKKVLLLFNIETILRMKTHNYRFSFNSYKRGKWSIEHIHAQNTDGLSTVKQWMAWIEDHIKSLERINANKYKEVIERMKSINEDNISAELFNKLFEEVQNCFKDQFSDDMHLINNLTLLDKDLNSRLGNSFFDVKRDIIIKMDKEGYFIPICTRNVFLKYYSKNASHLYFWGPEDRKDYYDEIIHTLQKYLPNQAEVNSDANN